MARLAICLLGTFQVTLAGRPVMAFESDKVRALLAYLVVESDRPHRREKLASLLWPNRPMPNARRNLSQALYNLRHAIQEGQAEPHFLLATYSAIRFNQESDHWVDVTALASLLATCRDHQHPTLVRCDPCKDRLERAARLCQGAFLDGFTLDGCPAFAEWALVEQKRSTRLSTAVLAALARCHEHCRDHGRALACARRCVRLAPWREPAHRQLMRSLAFTGQRRAALAHYQTWSRKLKEGLGLEPAPETVALAERIHDGLAPANP